MKRLIALLLMVLVTSTQPGMAGHSTWHPDRIQLWSQATPNYSSDELLVIFHDGVTMARIDAINESLNAQVISTLLPGRLYLVKVPTSKPLEQIRQAYASFSEVKSVSFNYQIKPD